jgi:hypothetical protein
MSERSFKIFQMEEGDGGVTLGVEFMQNDTTLARHNYSFGGDTTPEQIQSFLESQLNGKIAALERARSLAALLRPDINSIHPVAPPVDITFSPSPGPQDYPVAVTIAGAAPAGCEIRYTSDGLDPGELSSPYRIPITISAPTTIKAAVFTVEGARGAIYVATYLATQAPVAPAPVPLTKSAVLALLPQADISAAMANEGAWRVFQAFLIMGSETIADNQAGISKVKAFCDQFLAGAILSQGSYDAIRAQAQFLGWNWA